MQRLTGEEEMQQYLMDYDDGDDKYTY